jgi:parallel beta-helix repeat protein
LSRDIRSGAHQQPDPDYRPRTPRHREAPAATAEEATLLPRPAPRRRDVRLAARAKQAAATRVRRVRSATRLGVVALISAVVVPTGVVGGLAYALAGGGSGSMTLKPGSSAVMDTGVSFADGQGDVTFVLPGRPAGGSLYLGLELRTSGGSLYRTKARVYPDGALSVDIGKVIGGGAEQFLGTKRIPAVVGAGTTALTLQGSAIGNKVAVRAFAAGSTAPAWQLTATDAAPIGRAGSVRAWTYLSRQASAAITVKYQELGATKAGPVTVPPVTTAPTTTRPPVVPTTVPATTPPATTKPPVATTTAAPPPSPTTAPPNPTSPTMQSVLSASGANLDTNYPIPAGAVFAAPGGNNANSGAQGSPVQTIAAAIAKAPSGGTVVLRGGTYREAVGSVNKRLTIQAYPHEYPVISGADVVTAWTATAGVWRTTSWTSPFGQNQFRAEEVVAGTAAGRVEQAFRSGKSLRQVMTLGELKSGTFWINPTTMQLYVADDPTKATMEVSQRARGMTLEAGANGSRILGLRFTAYAAPHLDNSGNLYVGSSNTLIENSQFDHSSGAGLKIAGSNMTVRHITASDNAAEGMQGNRNDNSVVTNSQFLRNNTDKFKSEGCGMSCTVAGFKTAHTANLSVLNNAFVDNNNANGYWCDLGCTGGLISGNAVSGSFDGIFYEVSSRGTITGNYVEKSHKGIRVSGSDNVTITNNELVNNTWQLTVYDDRRSASTDSYSAGLGLSWNTTNLVINNNDITAGAQTEKLLEANATAQVASPQMFSKVVGNSNAGIQKMMWCPQNGTCKTYGTIAEWKAASGLSF